MKGLYADWTELDDNRATVEIVASADNDGLLFQRHRDGSIWAYRGVPLTGWTRLDSNPKSVQLAVGRGNLYQRHADGSIWEWPDAAAEYGLGPPGFVG